AARPVRQPDQLDQLRGVARVGVVAREVAYRLADGQVGEVGRGLQDDADPGPPRAAGPCRVHAEHLDLAGVAGTVPLQDLDRGRLAGAVGTEERVHLAGLDGQVDAADGDAITVPLVQSSDPDRVHASIVAVARSGYDDRPVEPRCPSTGGHPWGH